MLDHRILKRPRSARMRSNDRAVDDEVFHIRVIDEVLVHPFPDPSFAPSYKPLVYAIPLAILGRKQPPLCPGPSDPEDGLDKLLAFGFLADVQVRLTVQELENLGPLVWRKFNN